MPDIDIPGGRGAGAIDAFRPARMSRSRKARGTR